MVYEVIHKSWILVVVEIVVVGNGRQSLYFVVVKVFFGKWMGRDANDGLKLEIIKIIRIYNFNSKYRENRYFRSQHKT